MTKLYKYPHISVISVDNNSFLCSSAPIRKITEKSAPTSSANSSVYSSLSQRQKIAAMNLMTVFGGSCPGTSQNIDKINHIMTVEGGKMGVSGAQVHAAMDSFSGMPDMVDALKGANRSALESLFWAYYCIVAVGKSAQAVQVLLGVYRQLGFSEQDCLTILENRTGRKREDL